jgi:N-hydroxyarylamine O-acetyltransferase
MNLDAYLARLRLAKPLPPTLESLRRIHVAHLGAFPFHNLSIQRHRSVPVDVESLERKFLDGAGGGYCFEQNTLLAAALRELEFDVTLLLARVAPERYALNHLLLRVDIDGRPWLADAGFGGEGLLEPMPLEEDARVTQNGFEYTLRRDAHHWTLSLRFRDTVDDLYEFTGAPFTAGDVEVANYYTSTHPNSIFRRSLTIQRVTPDERVILRPRLVTHYRDGVRTDTPVEPRQLRQFALDLFGIDLGDEALLFEEQP